MKIISTDIETTGLDENNCQMIEFGAVIEDLNDRQPVEKLKKFHCYIIHDVYRGEPYALSMHPSIFKRIANREPGYSYLKPYEFAAEFPKFLKLHIPEDKRYTMTGKNFASFDLRFFRANPYFAPMTALFHHRVLDCGSLFFNPKTDTCLPSTEECLKRAGLTVKVAHTAIDDSIQIIELLRAFYK